MLSNSYSNHITKIFIVYSVYIVFFLSVIFEPKTVWNYKFCVLCTQKSWLTRPLKLSLICGVPVKLTQFHSEELEDYQSQCSLAREKQSSIMRDVEGVGVGGWGVDATSYISVQHSLWISPHLLLSHAKLNFSYPQSSQIDTVRYERIQQLCRIYNI